MPPLITCIMVTRGRPALAAKAIRMFRDQTWPRKELLVIVDVRGPGVNEIRNTAVGMADVRLLAPPPVDTYVQLRNLGIYEAAGDVVCMWDDDDLYHPERLYAQYNDMIAADAEASFIGDFMHLMEGEGEPQRVRYPWGGHPGTLMCLRSARPRYPEGPGPERGRDNKMQADLVSRVPSTILWEMPHLYTYVFHGGNIWDREHHEELVKKCHRLAMISQPQSP